LGQLAIQGLVTPIEVIEAGDDGFPLSGKAGQHEGRPCP
jgi:hypothetical protein